MKIVMTLVDYDNVIEQKERTRADVAFNLSRLFDSLTNHIYALIPDSEEIIARLYGGWITLGNQRTARADWLLAELPNFRRRIGNMRVKPSMITHLNVRQDLSLAGTYRSDEQKMVDGMLTVDALTFADDSGTSLAIVSDDDDFVPAAIGCSVKRSKRHPVLLLRRRKRLGDGSNDVALKACNVIVASH